MADMGGLLVDTAKLDQQVSELNSLLNELKRERDNANGEAESIRSNWSGDEADKGNPKLKEILNILDNAILDLEKQKNYLQDKKDRFMMAKSGF